MEPCLKCQPPKILIGAETLESRGKKNRVPVEVSGNELRFV